MGKVRSPNYPSISLADAIDLVRKVYEKDHRNRMAKGVVAQHLGYTSLNGASLTTISALAKYGLLDRSGEDYRVSDNAVAILVDQPGSPEHAHALKTAALQPPLFAEIQRHYQGSVPSEDNLRTYLQKRDFTASAASAASRAYRETMALVSGGDDGYAEGMPPKRDEEAPPVELRGGLAARGSLSASLTVTPAAEREWQRLALPGGRTVRLLFSGPEPTQPAVDTLIQILELTKRGLPQEEPS